MIKNKRFAIVALVVVALLITSHFVPVYSKTGVINYPSTNDPYHEAVCAGADLSFTDSTTGCNSNKTPTSLNYRVIIGGLGDYKYNKKYFTEGGQAQPETSGIRVNLRLYLL